MLKKNNWSWSMGFIKCFLWSNSKQSQSIIWGILSYHLMLIIITNKTISLYNLTKSQISFHLILRWKTLIRIFYYIFVSKNPYQSCLTSISNRIRYRMIHFAHCWQRVKTPKIFVFEIIQINLKIKNKVKSNVKDLNFP